MAAEKFECQGDQQAAQVACRSVLYEPVTDQIWRIQIEAAAHLSDDEHLIWLLHVVKSGYAPALERLSQFVGHRLQELISTRRADWDELVVEFLAEHCRVSEKKALISPEIKNSEFRTIHSPIGTLLRELLRLGACGQVHQRGRIG